MHNDKGWRKFVTKSLDIKCKNRVGGSNYECNVIRQRSLSITKNLGIKYLNELVGLMTTKQYKAVELIRN